VVVSEYSDFNNCSTFLIEDLGSIIYLTSSVENSLLDIGYWILDIGYWILDIGYWILDIGYWIFIIKLLTIIINIQQVIINFKVGNQLKTLLLDIHPSGSPVAIEYSR
jgi:hypothetical protein